MIDTFREYYREHLTFFGLVIKKSGKRGKIRNILIGIFFSLMIAFSICSNFIISLHNGMVIYSLMGLALLVLLYLLIRFDSQFQLKTIKNLYPESLVSKNKWSIKEIDDRIQKNLDQFLFDNNLKGKAKIEELQKIITEKAKNEKLPYIVYSSCFAVLIIPLWNAYITRILDLFKTNLMFLNFMAFFLAFIVLIISYVILKLSIINETIFTRYSELNKMNQLLDEYKLTFKEESLPSNKLSN